MIQKLEKVTSVVSLPKLIENFGALILFAFNETGRVAMFFTSTMRWVVQRPFRFKEIIIQIEFIGNQSLFIILLSSLFTGMVFALQTYSGFKMVNAQVLIGPSVALALMRELSPVLSALIVTGRAGAAMTAQLGTMRVTEQIDALDVMGVNPKQYLVMPRIIASVIVMPLLASVSAFIGNVGAYFLATRLLLIDGAVYMAKVNMFARPRDVAQCIIKAAFFGLIFSVIGTYKGFNCENGARGVGKATNETVVVSSILILVSDYFLSAIIRMFLYEGFR
ncbi:MAG: ABC transporter permease [Oligoflexia bacterium]|nr:ABC transporter permease [Oligoflexia bacterium]